MTESADGRVTPTVTFETKVWEGDFRVVLDERRLQWAVETNCWDFTTRIVYVNNVDDPRRVLRRGRSLVESGVVDDIVLVAEHAGAALSHFGLSKVDLGRGYPYSISELVSLYLSTTDYVLHFAGDTVLGLSYDWMPGALALLGCRSEVAVVNASWTPDISTVEGESFGRDGDFLLGFGFSDQMYLVRTSEFSQPIYGESHVASERYPEYGGELFEKRVDSWMRNNGRLRATWTGGYYVHKNIRRLGFAARLGRLRTPFALGD